MKNQISIRVTLVLLIGILFNAHSQNPDAEFVTQDINVCESGQITIELKIRFYGDAYFGFKIKDPNGLVFTNSHPIYDEDLIDSVFTEVYHFFYDVPDGETKRTGTFEILEVFDSSNGGTWKSLSGKEIVFTNWGVPKPFAGADIDSCGLKVQLNAVPDTISDTYYWAIPSEGSLLDVNDPKTIFTATNAGSYVLIFNQENGVCKASDEVNVLLKGSPAASLSTSSEVCGTSEQTATLNLSFQGDNGPWDYSITDGTSPVIQNSSSSITTNETIPVQGETTFSFLWLRDKNGCYASPEDISDSAIVRDIQPSPNAGNDTAVCGIKSIVLNHPLSAKAQEGEWTSDSGIFIPGDTPNTTIFEAQDWGEHIIYWNESNKGCSASDHRIIRFDEMPIAKIKNGNSDTLFHTNQTTLYAQTPLEYPEKSNWTGQWSISSGNAEIVNPLDTTTIINIKEGPVTLEWSVNNGVCPLQTQQFIIYLENLSYYTGISPNMDGKNDYFKINGAEEIPENELIVFDKNGKVVYRIKEFQKAPNETRGWDGTGMDGTPLESGIYYFIFKGKDIESIQDYLIIKRH